MTEERRRKPKEAVTTPGAALRDPEALVRPSDAGLSSIGSAQLWGKKIAVVDEIDRGGMSYIARGRDLTLQRELALKVSPLPRKDMPRAQLARFIEEAQITAQLEHPNVVPVHELGLDPDGRIYFTMKLVRGRSLEAILDKRRSGDAETLSEFGLRRLLDVFVHVCHALEYAHARGVVHRDLKPANIMVGDFGEVLVMDWGVAKLVGGSSTADAVAVEVSGAESDEPDPAAKPGSRVSDVTSLRSGKEALATQAGALIGTPAYMSPEQARGEPADERSDLYALGTMLYEILCDRLPFDEEDPSRLLLRVITEKPEPPSKLNPAAPLALEALALRLLEKDPERRDLTLAQVRAHIQDWVEGIGRDYRRPSLWSNVLWTVGALSLFAFLVWYLTGESIAALFVLAPATVFNAVGWFLVILALGSPLWSAYLALRLRGERDRFGPPSADEQLVGRYLAQRTLAATIAPIFQLVFIVELASYAIDRARFGQIVSAETMTRISAEVRAQWAQSLVVILIFLFGYLFFLSSEVRFARRIDRYELLVARPRWESVWPFFLIFLLLVTLGTTHVLDWALAGHTSFGSFVRQHVLAEPLDLIEMGKTLVFQGTFLSALVLAVLLLAFTPAEVIAALRLPYQPADDAAVRHRTQYFARSMAVFRVARVSWLYGGAMIGGLTAMTVLSQPVALPLVKQVLYILGPSLVGFLGYGVTRRQVTRFFAHSPAARRALDRQVRGFRLELSRIAVERLRKTPWRHRALQLVVPFVCLAAFLIWSGSGIHQRAIEKLIMPVTTQGWLLILPYALLIPILLTRDFVQRRLAERRLRKHDVAA